MVNSHSSCRTRPNCSLSNKEKPPKASGSSRRSSTSDSANCAPADPTGPTIASE
jgi:hypothetical protein